MVTPDEIVKKLLEDMDSLGLDVKGLRAMEPFLREAPTVLASHLANLLTPQSLSDAMLAYTRYLMEDDKLLIAMLSQYSDEDFVNEGLTRETFMEEGRRVLERRVVEVTDLNECRIMVVMLQMGSLLTIEDVLREVPYVLLF